ncbi:PREDICTED: basic proline-rich protein-like, partial [Chinchilla lanigera]|uniref:basic proline-rich protein-like n=1 Tax=Chinchilla lanigera TaxID=34839 RepID=UPI000695EDF8
GRGGAPGPSGPAPRLARAPSVPAPRRAAPGTRAPESRPLPAPGRRTPAGSGLAVTQQCRPRAPAPPGAARTEAHAGPRPRAAQQGLPAARARQGSRARDARRRGAPTPVGHGQPSSSDSGLGPGAPDAAWGQKAPVCKAGAGGQGCVEGCGQHGAARVERWRCGSGASSAAGETETKAGRQSSAGGSCPPGRGTEAVPTPPQGQEPARGRAAQSCRHASAA